MLLNPKEALKMMKQTEESTVTTGEPTRGFKKLSQIFGGKDKLLTRPVSQDVNKEEKCIRQSFSSFFESKSSLLSKKCPKPGYQSPVETLPSLESDWTFV